jgi:hypothetical protein
VQRDLVVLDVDLDVFPLYAGNVRLDGIALVVFLDVDLDAELGLLGKRKRSHEEALAEIVEQVFERVIAGDVRHGSSPMVG